MEVAWRNESSSRHHHVTVGSFLHFHRARLIQAVRKSKREYWRNVLRNDDAGSIRGHTRQNLANCFCPARGRADRDHHIRAKGFADMVSVASTRAGLSADAGRRTRAPAAARILLNQTTQLSDSFAFASSAAPAPSMSPEALLLALSVQIQIASGSVLKS